MSGVAKGEESIVVVGPEGMLELWSDLPETTRTSAYAMIKGVLPALRLYQGDGNVSRVREANPPFQLGPIRRLLARTVYNPRFEVRLTYEQQPYELADLKGQILAAIALDDDIITQFHDAATISGWIRDASSFREIVAALRHAEHEDDEA